MAVIYLFYYLATLILLVGGHQEAKWHVKRCSSSNIQKFDGDHLLTQNNLENGS